MVRKKLEDNIHYKVFLRTQENPLGGRPTQEYLLTPNGFKQLCMAATRPRPRQVREY